MKKIVSRALLIVSPLTLAFASSLVCRVPITQAATESHVLGTQTANQQNIRHGLESMQSKILNGTYKNLADVIVADVTLHEQNGMKFGGVSFTISNSPTQYSTYTLSSDTLHEEVYQADLQQPSIPGGSSLNEPAKFHKVSDRVIGNFQPSNKSKFSHLTRNLIDILSRVPMSKQAPHVDTSVAHASTATTYDGYQSHSYLNFWQSVYYYGSGYHDVNISSHYSWTGTDNGEADPGPKDGMDVEWNPGQLYMTSADWQPNTRTVAGPFGWNGTHDIAIDSSDEWYAGSGGFYVEPDHNCKSGYVEVFLDPVNSSVIGSHGNYYGNYIHAWNWTFMSGISFSVGYGAFSISWAPSNTGSTRTNLYGTYYI